MTLTDEYRFRQVESAADAQRIRAHFSEVYFEPVRVFTEVLYHHYPGMSGEHFYLAEEKATSKIVSAFMLMPWTWEIEGVELKIAQMTGAATCREYRRRGLFRELFKRFHQACAEEEYDLTVINGIKGFYRQFGYCFAIPVENYIKLPLHLIPEQSAGDVYTFRLADEGDIPYLMEEDDAYRKFYSISTLRDEAAWKFLLDEHRYSVYGSDFWIMEHKQNGERFYCRIPEKSHFGGHGLLVSEVSDRVDDEALGHLFAFWQRKALEGQKPYIRLNLHDNSRAGKMALALGAEAGGHMAWQIRMLDPARFLKKIAPVLEKRLSESALKGFCGTLRLDFFRTRLDLLWEAGKLVSVTPGEGRQAFTFRVHGALFPMLCLGHRSWSEMAHIWPDIGPAHGPAAGKTALLIETLFPTRSSWLYEPV